MYNFSIIKNLLTLFCVIPYGVSLFVVQYDAPPNQLPARMYTVERSPTSLISHAHGLILHPVDYVEIPDTVWKYVIKFDLPCLSDHISGQQIIEWRATINAIISSLDTLRKVNSMTNTNVEDISALSSLAKTVSNRIDQAEEAYKETSERAQYLWGLIKLRSICADKSGNFTSNLGEVKKVKDLITQFKSKNMTSPSTPSWTQQPILNISTVSKSQTELGDVVDLNKIENIPITTRVTTLKSTVTTTTAGVPPVNVNDFESVTKKSAPYYNPEDNTIRPEGGNKINRNKKSKRQLSHESWKFVLPRDQQMTVSNINCKLEAGFTSGQPTSKPGTAESREDVLNDEADQTTSPHTTPTTDTDVQSIWLKQPFAIHYQQAVRSIFGSSTNEPNAILVGTVSRYSIWAKVCVINHHNTPNIDKQPGCQLRKFYSDTDIQNHLHERLAGVKPQKLWNQIEEFSRTPLPVDLNRFKRDTLITLDDVVYLRVPESKMTSCITSVNIGEDATLNVSHDRVEILTSSNDYTTTLTIGTSLQNCFTLRDLKDSMYPRQTRVKREDSWWTRSVWQPLFGFASKDDVEAVRKDVDSNQANIGRIIELQNSLLTISKTQTSAMTDMHDAMDKTIKELQSYATNMTSTVTNLLSEQEGLAQSVDFIARLSTLHIQLSRLESELSSIIYQLSSIIDKYNLMKEMFTRGNLDVRVFSESAQADFDKAFSQTSLYRLPRDWPGIYNLNQRFASAHINEADRTLIFILNIPLMKIGSPRDTFRVITYPLITDDQKFRVSTQHDYIQIAPDTSHWYGLSTSEYIQCRLETFRVCNYRFMEHVSLLETCATSLTITPAPQPNVCRAVVDHTDNDVTSFTQISKTQWIGYVSPKSNDINISATVACSGSTTSMSDEILLVKGYQVITIEDGCTVTTQDVILTPVHEWWVSHGTQIEFDTSIRRSDYNNSRASVMLLSKPSITKMSGHIKLPQINLSSASASLNTTNNLLTKVTELTNSTENDNLILLFHNRVGSKVFPSDWNPVWTMLSSGFSILCIIAIVILILRYVRRPTVPLAAVAFTRVPAAVSAASVLGNTTTNNINQTSWEVIVKALEDHQHHLTIFMCVTMILMILMHILHCYMLAKNNRLITHTLRSVTQASDFCVENLLAIHYTGEPIVTAYCLLEVTNIFRQVVDVPISLQVATLPNPLSQWYMERSTNLAKLIRGITCYRWSRTCQTKFDWSKACIKSTEFPNLDICAEMPVRGSFRTSDISHIIPDAMTYTWFSMKLKICIGLECRYGSERNVLYHYIRDRPGVFDSAVRLLE